MYINLSLSNSVSSFTFVKTLFNQMFNSLRLVKSFLTTDSATTNVYYLYIGGLYSGNINNNFSDKSLIPLYVGGEQNDMKLELLNHSINNSYEFTIYDSAGVTSDAVTVDLLFELI